MNRLKTDSEIKEASSDSGEEKGQNLLEFQFDRYRSGKRMAEGALVLAESYSEAVRKARQLFHECPNDVFRLRHRI